MANKFDIDQLRLQIEALIRDNPDLAEYETLRADMLDGQTDMTGALSALLDAADTKKYMVAAINQRMDDLAARRARYKQGTETLRGLILKVLQSADLKRVELPQATITQRNGQPQIVGEVDVNALPADLCRATIEPNRVAIREALMEGRVLPGLSLSNGPPTLTINVK